MRMKRRSGEGRKRTKEDCSGRKYANPPRTTAAYLLFALLQVIVALWLERYTWLVVKIGQGITRCGLYHHTKKCNKNERADKASTLKNSLRNKSWEAS